MIAPTFRQILNKPLIGALIGSSLPIPYIEQLGMVGYDYIWVDAEHGTITPTEAQCIFTAAERRNMATLARVHLHDSANVQRYLDCGTQAVLFPQINSRSDAELAVQLCKFPPYGTRGLASARWNDYSLDPNKTLKDGIQQVNSGNGVVIGVQIETQEAVDNAREILEVEGVDFVFLGPADLSVSLGVPGEMGHESVKSVMRDVANIAKDVGMPVGTVLLSRQDCKEWSDMGYTVNVAIVDLMFAAGAKGLLQSMRGRKK